MAHLKFFPTAFIALQHEIATNHPQLRENLSNHTDKDPELQFAKCMAEIATYCNIVLDDTYTPERLIEMADVFVERLRKLGAPIITTTGGAKLRESSPLILPPYFER